MSKLAVKIFRCFEGMRGTRNQLKTELEKCLKEVENLERQLEEARELTNKYIKRTEGILQSLYEDGSEEGHSEFFYRMNSKEQILHEGFLRKLKQLKEKGDE